MKDDGMYLTDGLYTFLLFGTVLGVILGVLCLFIFFDNSIDVVGIQDLGTVLCSEQGLQFGHVEYVPMDVPGHTEKIHLPRFYCKDADEGIIDGIVVKEGD